MIKGCFDANVLISHLLNPTAGRPPNRIVETAIAQEFELILIESTLGEMIDAIRSKPYLTARIDLQNAHDLENALRLTATVLPETLDHLPSITRDPGDDYLIAHAILHEIDYLVSGDNDLLELGEFEGVRIVSPAEFVEILETLS